MKNILLALFLSFFMVSCATQTFYFNSKASEESIIQTKINDSDTFYVAGIGQKKSHNPVEICGGLDKVAKVETQLTFMNIVFAALTFSVYTPRQFRVYCKVNV